MKRRWRWLLVLVLVLVMLEVTGQSGIFRASTLGGRTITNVPWQLSGSRTAGSGGAPADRGARRVADTVIA